MAEAARMHVTLVFSPAARQVRQWELELPNGATVLDALRASAIQTEYPGLDADGAAVGVWGRTASASLVLHDGDRVEVYRPLRVDPKMARRERFRAQGARAAGLFGSKRPGAKSRD